MRKGSKFYEEDYDDGWEDDYDDEEEEAGWYGLAETKQAPPPARPQAPAAPAKGPVRASEPSALAKGLTKPQQAPANKAAAAKIAAQAKAPQPSQKFAFDTPSPDDLALQRLKAGGAKAAAKAASGASTISSAHASENIAMKLQQKLNLGSSSEAAGRACGEGGVLAGDQVSAGKAAGTATNAGTPAPASTPLPAAPRRPVSEYRVSSGLAQACASALVAEKKAGAKARLHLVVLGHVDAGKSTLMGRFLFELGLVNQRTVHKTQKEAAAAGKASFVWAWMLDERPEERARGITVDVAMTRFETAGRQVTLLDAPGHRDFVPAMIAGAAQADAALLVVDCSPGGFEAGFAPPAGPGSIGGQTREHAQLARALGISQLTVVGTKLDMVDGTEGQQARFEVVRSQLGAFLRTVGFPPAAVQWLPATGPSGDNLRARGTDAGLGLWWQGPTLEQAIDGMAPTVGMEADQALNPKTQTGSAVDRLPAVEDGLPAAARLPFRMTVSEAAPSRGGVSLSGRVMAGAATPGATVLVQPCGQRGTIKSVDGATAGAAALPGSTTELVLAGLDEPGVVGPGSVLCEPEFPCHAATGFLARVLMLDCPGPILPGQQVSVHCHTAREGGTLRRLQVDGPTGLRPARFLLAGQRAVVEVALTRPLAADPAAEVPALGRLVLRDGGRTLAAGLVLECL